ncbi:allophanate hydrolase [Aquabacterium sp. CECT 9606]|uniref:allophanate hydrolase n=1 Tax=Aquabacterium sp. CECT 9606 TaxID=2845822 RepID=UPI001E5BF6ED|nr:allophanate hydrolase [Aquabacterium sp. CECT 9606]CAH0347915.1 Allophanate hydrolase [Aquabacterium sp. CECT 9606]
MSIPHTISGLLTAYREGALTPAQVFARFLTAPPATPEDPAWIHRAPADFIQAQLDALAGQSPATLPLFGIPFGVKDNIDVAGLPTTAACPAFAYMPKQSATVVQRLMAAGAIVVGKTNLDQFATGLVGARSPYGVPTSTFSDEHVSGGSSSGSAVVVARGEVAFALGTDTAGSGRVPAGFNNLVGIKPTPGLVPTGGVVPACKSLDCVSIFALTASDGARVLAVVEGPQAGEPVFNQVNLQAPRLPAKLRVGVPMAPEFFGDAEYAGAFDRAQAQWAGLRDVDGQPWPVELVPVDLSPFMAVARLLYEGPWVAERYAAISDFIASHADDINPVVRGIIEGARQHDAVSAFKGQYRLRELAQATLPTWQHIDVLMVPTAPTMPTLASVQADPVVRNSQLGTYTNFVNLLGLAALALPSGFTARGLPFGITLIAPGGSDAALLDLGALWQQALACSTTTPLGHALNAPTDAELTWPCGVQALAAPTLMVSVVGAHLSGMPLHNQLTERQARLVSSTRTAPHYRLFALPGTVPPKPGLVRVSADAPPAEGHAIAVEVYAMPQSSVGSFLALIPPPLGLGSVELEDGSWVKGFICEPCGLLGAEDISQHGGWRAYMNRKTA